MEIFFALLLGLVLLGFPVVALIAFFRTITQAKKIKHLHALNELSQVQIDRMNRKLTDLMRRARKSDSDEPSELPVADIEILPPSPSDFQIVEELVPPPIPIPPPVPEKTPAPDTVDRPLEIPLMIEKLSPPQVPAPKKVPARKSEPPVQRDQPPMIVFPKPKRDWEALLGTQVFLKLGVVVVVLGMVLFLGYAFTRVGPIGKVLTGMACAVTMLVGGLYAESINRYRQFGRSLIAGGWGTLYFVAFSMHYVPAARVIENPIVAVLAMVLAAVLAVIHSLKYRNEWTTAFAFLLIFLSLGLSAWEQQAIFNLVATVTAVVAANGLALKMRWSRLQLVAHLAGWICATLWILIQMHNQVPLQITAVFFMLSVLWVSGQVTQLKWPQSGPNRWHAVSSIVHACFALGLGLHILQTSAPQWSYLWPLALGILGLGTCFVLRLRDDRVSYLVQATLSLAALALVAPLKWGFGHEWLPILRLFGVQSIWIAGLLLRDKYFRKLAYLLFGIAFIEIALRSLIDLQGPTRAMLLAGTSLLTLVNAFLTRTWARVYCLDRENEILAPVFSWLTIAFAVQFIWMTLPQASAAPCLALLAVIWHEVGCKRGENDLLMQSATLIIVAILALVFKAPLALNTVALGTTTLACYLMYERAIRQSSKRAAIALTALIAGGGVLIWLVIQEIELPWSAATLAWIGLAHQLWSWRSSRTHLLLGQAAFSVVALLLFVNYWIQSATVLFVNDHVLAGLLILAALYSGFALAWSSRKQEAANQTANMLLYTVIAMVTAILGLALSWTEIHPLWLSLSGAGIACIGLGLAKFKNCRPLAYQSWAYIALSAAAYAIFLWQYEGQGWFASARLEHGVLAYSLLILAHFINTRLKNHAALWGRSLVSTIILVLASTCLLVLVKIDCLASDKNLLVALIWLAMGTLYVEVARYCQRSNWFQTGHVIIVLGALHALLVNVIQAGSLSWISYRALTLLPVLGFLVHAYVNWGKAAQSANIQTRIQKARPIYIYLASAILAIAMVYEFHRAWVIVGWASMAAIGLWCRWTFGNNHGRNIAWVMGFAITTRAFAINFAFRDSLQDLRINLAAIPIALLLILVCYFLQYKIGQEADYRKTPLSRPFWLLLLFSVLTGLIWFETSGTSLTIWLSLEGLFAVSLGFIAKDYVARWSGLGFLVFCILKLFVYDLRGLTGLPRIFSFIVLGLVLIGVSFAYTRFKEHLEKR